MGGFTRASSRTWCAAWAERWSSSSTTVPRTTWDSEVLRMLHHMSGLLGCPGLADGSLSRHTCSARAGPPFSHLLPCDGRPQALVNGCGVSPNLWRACADLPLRHPSRISFAL